MVSLDALEHWAPKVHFCTQEQVLGAVRAGAQLLPSGGRHVHPGSMNVALDKANIIQLVNKWRWRIDKDCILP